MGARQTNAQSENQTGGFAAGGVATGGFATGGFGVAALMSALRSGFVSWAATWFARDRCVSSTGSVLSMSFCTSSSFAAERHFFSPLIAAW